MGIRNEYKILVLKVLKGHYHLGDQSIKGRIILKWILEKQSIGLWTWIHLAQGRIQWRALVDVIMNLRFP